jgi:hypothetical protein
MQAMKTAAHHHWKASKPINGIRIVVITTAITARHLIAFIALLSATAATSSALL